MFTDLPVGTGKLSSNYPNYRPSLNTHAAPQPPTPSALSAPQLCSSWWPAETEIWIQIYRILDFIGIENVIF